MLRVSPFCTHVKRREGWNVSSLKRLKILRVSRCSAAHVTPRLEARPNAHPKSSRCPEGKIVACEFSAAVGLWGHEKKRILSGADGERAERAYGCEVQVQVLIHWLRLANCSNDEQPSFVDNCTHTFSGTAGDWETSTLISVTCEQRKPKPSC